MHCDGDRYLQFSRPCDGPYGISECHCRSEVCEKRVPSRSGQSAQIPSTLARRGNSVRAYPSPLWTHLLSNQSARLMSIIRVIQSQARIVCVSPLTENCILFA